MVEMEKRLAAIVALVVISGCGPSPSNSMTERMDGNIITNAAANDINQNAPVEPIVPRMPPAPDLSTLEGRTEAAMIDQLRCQKPVKAAKVVNAMLKDGLLKETDDGADGSSVYIPNKPMSLLGFPLIRVTGWQMMENSGDAVPPFVRGPGVPPPDFFEVTVRASPMQIRSAIKAIGIREGGWRPDPARIAIEIDGKWYRPQRQVPGMVIEEGDMWQVKARMKGVTTLSCTTDETTFDP